MKEKDKRDENGFFWKRNENLKRIKILNPLDFHYPEMAKENDPKITGLADEEEIIARNEITRFLFDRPELREKINKWLTVCSSNHGSLPSNENEFLDFYGKENSYWQLVNEIITRLEKESKLPQRLNSFLSDLKNSLPLLEEEAEMAKRIEEQLKKTTIMSGFLEINLEGKIHEHSRSFMVGQKAFNSTWSPSYVAPIWGFFKTGFFRLFRLNRLAQIIANKIAENRAKKSAVLSGIPLPLLSDIKAGLKKLLTTFHGLSVIADGMKIPEAEVDAYTEKKNAEIFENFKSMEHEKSFFGIKVTYDSKGLQVTPLYIGKPSSRDTYIDLSSYKAASNKDKQELRKLIAKSQEKMNFSLGLSHSQLKIDFLKKNTNFRIGETYAFKSRDMDRNFRWEFLCNLYVSKENEKIYNTLLDNRKMLYRRLYELQSICQKMHDMMNYAEACKMPICVPTLRKSGSGINFKNLAPIAMFSQKKKMVPFSFPRINGQMICLTGRHGRGKSISGMSVLQAQWLAQSGYLVFADSYEFDIKEVLGSVVNDIGNDSTASTFVAKTAVLFANLKKVPAKKSLVFIDEIGKGTQEKSGFELGADILNTIKFYKYSAIVNTQILNLAEYSQKEMGGVCLKVNKKYQFKPGIGEGEMNELRKEKGLDKHLIKVPKK